MSDQTLLNKAALLTGVASMVTGLALLTAAPALAQAADAASEELGNIVVTGTRIARPDLEQSSPVRVIGVEEIKLRQATTTEELLRDLPSVRPSIGPGVNNGSDGSASIDLRGMGTNRTLVLFDGRRMVPFGLTGITDTNTIPVALVERVDVVTGGASSVYGADAVAGVVNFVSRRDFAGVDLSGNYRITGRGDAQAYKLDLTVGANLDDNRGNVVMSIGYTTSNALNQDRRPFGVASLSTVNGQPQGSQTAVPSFLIGPAIPGVADPVLGSVFDPATNAFRRATQADLYNFNPDNL